MQKTPNDNPAVLAVDVGTSAVKCVLIGLDGEHQREAKRAYGSTTPGPGMAEQDPAVLIDATLDAAREIIEACGDSPPIAVALSTQMYSVIGLDDDMRPVTGSITWADTRASEQAEALAQQPDANELHRATGCYAAPLYPLAKCAWLRQHADQKPTRYGSIKDLLIHRLTGRWVLDHSCASATGMLNLQQRSWHGDALRFAGIKPEQLPLPVPTRYRIEGWSPLAQERAGLTDHTPLIVGGGDGPLANLGLGAVRPGLIAVNVGTSAAARIATERADEPLPEGLWRYAADDGLWVTGGILTGAGSVYEQAKQHWMPGQNDRAVNAAIAQLPPSDALPELIDPVHPDHDNAWAGLTPRHTPTHRMKAVLVYVVQQLGDIIKKLTACTDAESYAVRIAGGMAQSDVFCQLAADAWGLPVERPSSIDASARGAAVLAFRALGLLDDDQSLPESSPSRRFTPVRAS